MSRRLESRLDAAKARAAVDEALEAELEEAAVVGTGYDRVTLPFPKEQIRSEILCHVENPETVYYF